MGGTEPDLEKRVAGSIGSVALVVLLCRVLFFDTVFQQFGLAPAGIAFDLLLLVLIVVSLVGRVRAGAGGRTPERA